jgi:propionate catabolism operon transcriptional regulator
MPLNNPPASSGALPRLCFLCYPQIRQLAMPVLAEYRDRAEIEVVEGAFGNALSLAQSRLNVGAVDVFVSAGSNSSLLRQSLQAPVATIQLTGFDIMQCLIKASALTQRIGIVMFGQNIPELDAVRHLLKIEIRQHVYQSREDVRTAIGSLKVDGFEVVVGPSLAVSMAEEAGLKGLLAYSIASIRQGFEHALELARVARLETGRFEQLSSVLHNLHDAVLAVDRQERIVAINPAMQRLLGHPEHAALGLPLSELAPELSLVTTLRSGQVERGVVQRYAGRDWVLNRTAMREAGEVVGAALTVYDAGTIHEADNRLRMQQRQLQNTARHHFDDLLGRSSSLLKTVATARRYAQTDLGVLLVGESGTGKEMFAQAMHNESARRGRPFVAINCAAFPETLLESELFGHEEGAFTGARRGGRRGLFEAAHTGTLFLDEIGDMPLTLQTRLLRVLQEREITRLGSNQAIPIDVRIMAATHQDLPALLHERRFRQDLYYRLNTLRLALPALRERRSDIPAMVHALVALCLDRLRASRPMAEILEPLMPHLMAHCWPGNVRELENISERIAVYLMQFRPGTAVDFGPFQLECPELFHLQSPSSLMQLPARIKRAQQALKEQGGSHARAARQLGIARTTLWRWLQQ